MAAILVLPVIGDPDQAGVEESGELELLQTALVGVHSGKALQPLAHRYQASEF